MGMIGKKETKQGVVANYHKVGETLKLRRNGDSFIVTFQLLPFVEKGAGEPFESSKDIVTLQIDKDFILDMVYEELHKLEQYTDYTSDEI